MSARHAVMASATVRMPRSRSLGTRAWNTAAVVIASPVAECRPVTSTPSQLAIWSSEYPARSRLATCASRRVSSRRGCCQEMPANWHSRFRTAMSNPTVWPMTMRSPICAASSGHSAAKATASVSLAASMPWMAVAALGIGSPGCTRRHQALSGSMRPPAMRTTATSSRRALPASRPVVSVSRTTASIPISGVALPVVTIARPPDRCLPRVQLA